MVLHSFQGIAVLVIMNFKRQQRIAFWHNTIIEALPLNFQLEEEHEAANNSQKRSSSHYFLFR
ncbi:hypothetical protein T11_4039 [Trichinella zimbabwensis]|uniref:Uncharacterized protein n=1 Tax=Trichinella zimbabwensis TaxID=268475 RepID=A0A0V1G942_9BILA|nr:hypothetical protein T11_4039 [Trichinella zimbabwensis]